MLFVVRRFHERVAKLLETVPERVLRLELVLAREPDNQTTLAITF